MKSVAFWKKENNSGEDFYQKLTDPKSFKINVIRNALPVTL